MKFIHKIILMPLLAAVAFFIILSIAKLKSTQNEKISKQIETGYFPALEMSRDLREALANIQRGLQDAVAAADEDKFTVTDELKDHFINKLQQEKDNVCFKNDELKKLEVAFIDYYTLARRNSLNMIRGETGDDFLTSLNKMRTDYNNLKDAIEVATAKKKKDMEKAFAVSRASQKSLINIISVTTFFGLILLVGISVIIIRSLQKPLKSITNIAEEIAEGNLNNNFNYSSNDEIGQLANAFHDMSEALKAKAKVAEQIAEGNLEIKIDILSSEDILGKAMTNMKDNIKSMATDINELSTAAIKGDLSTRIDHLKHLGVFSTITQGIDFTLDAMMGPISDGIEVLEKVANKDLAIRIDRHYEGDHDKFKSVLNKTIENLNKTISQVATSAEHIRSASDHISKGSQSLSEATTEQAGSLEEVSSSLKEMASITRQNTDNTNEASRVSEAANSATSEGMQSMNELSEVIDKIKVSADETSKVVKTIDDIAFQTNLLALNAAVEAARAGEAGKGFAVVAEEVRNLAMRSAEAAKSTSNLIEESIENAEAGVDVNQKVYTNLENINSHVQKVNNIINEITNSSVQQKQGIDQIDSAIDQLNQLTQQNAARSEESASTAEELTGQSRGMQDMVNSFKLAEDDSSNLSIQADGSVNYNS